MSTKEKTTTSESTAKAAEEVLETVIETGVQTFDNIMKASVDAATQGYEKATAYSASELGKTTDAFKKVEEFGKQNAATMDAVTKVMTDGMEAYRTRLLDSWKNVAAFNTACLDRVTASKDPQEIATAQMEALVEVSQRSVADAIDLNKIALDTVAKASAPGKARVEEIVELAVMAA